MLPSPGAIEFANQHQQSVRGRVDVRGRIRDVIGQRIDRRRRKRELCVHALSLTRSFSAASDALCATNAPSDSIFRRAPSIIADAGAEAATRIVMRRRCTRARWRRQRRENRIKDSPARLRVHRRTDAGSRTCFAASLGGRPDRSRRRCRRGGGLHARRAWLRPTQSTDVCVTIVLFDSSGQISLR